MKVLVVSKVTSLTRAKTNGNTLPCEREQTLQRAHDAHESFVALLKSELESHSIEADFIRLPELDSINPSCYDFVISCGGDGTFLSIAQHFPDVVIIGINSDKTRAVKKGSIGALTNVNRKNLPKSIAKLASGKYVIEKWPRLCATVNGKLIPSLATNDIYFGHPVSYQTTHFSLRWGKHREHFHGSSGLLVTTGIGSTAWYHNEGGTPFTRELAAFAFVVRAPHMKRQPAFTQGIVPEQFTLELQANDDGYTLSFDSKQHQITVNHGDIIRIGINKEHPVRVVQFH